MKLIPRTTEWDELAQAAFSDGAWRPTVAMLVRVEEDGGKILLIGKWRFASCKLDIPKGGINVGANETVDDAMMRELQEESGIRPDCVRESRRLGVVSIPSDAHNRNRDGFTSGKLLFCHAVTVTKDGIAQAINSFEPRFEEGIVALYMAAPDRCIQMLHLQPRKFALVRALLDASPYPA